MTQDDGERRRPAAMVVNDDAIQLRILSAQLEREGLDVTAFLSATEALDTVTQPPDLIVTDLHMPEIDGWRLCGLIRSPEYAALNDVPVLVVSATFSGKDAREISASLGANTFLPSPVEQSSLHEQVRALLDGEVPRHTPDVLVVDDSRTICRSLSKAFKANGHDVRVALTGESGMALFRARPADIVILDYHLPDMTGDRLLDEFSRDNPLTIFVMITTDTNPELALRWLRQGASAYVRKPFDAKYLISLCETAQRARSLLHVEDLLEARTLELRESEARFREVIANISDVILIADENGVVKYVSPNIAKLFGWPLEERLGAAVWDTVHQDDAACARGQFERALEHEGEPNTLECRYICKDGTCRDVELTAVSMLRNSLVNGVLITCRNISARKTQEEERLSLEARIRQAQKFESLNVMAGSIAHSFNNMLMAVLGHLDLAMDDAPRLSPARHSIEEADRAAKRAAELSTLMLTYVGQGQLDIRTLDMAEMAEEMAATLNADLPEKIALTYARQAGPALFEGDPIKIRQVIASLVANAAEAIAGADGAIALSVSTLRHAGGGGKEAAAAQQVHVEGYLPEGEYVYCEVSDTGEGMDAENLAKALDPFFTTKFAGRGMGLATVLGIVRMHQGGVSLQSEPGKGTTARVLFPAGASGLVRKAATAAEPKTRPIEEGGTVLIVDDEEILLKVCGTMVRRIGFDVLTAARGHEALEIFREHAGKIRCVLLDLTMPGMGGEETLRELRRIDAKVPVIVASGFAASKAANRFGGAPPAAFIEKPFRMELLAETIRKVLGTQELSD